MARKRKTTRAEKEAWDERTRRLDERLDGIFSRTTFDERTRMIEERIAQLEARAAAKAGDQS